VGLKNISVTQVIENTWISITWFTLMFSSPVQTLKQAGAKVVRTGRIIPIKYHLYD